MAKLSDTETLIKFKEWLHQELSSSDVNYAFVIDQVNGALYQIQEFGWNPGGGISYERLNRLIDENRK